MSALGQKQTCAVRKSMSAKCQERTASKSQSMKEAANLGGLALQFGGSGRQSRQRISNTDRNSHIPALDR